MIGLPDCNSSRVYSQVHVPLETDRRHSRVVGIVEPLPAPVRGCRRLGPSVFTRLVHIENSRLLVEGAGAAPKR